MKNFRLFPDVIIRLSGGPLNELDELNFVATRSHAEELIKLNKRIDELKSELDPLLYEVISTHGEHKRAKFLLNLKRDIFNDRNSVSKSFESVRDLLGEKTIEKVDDYINFRAKLQAHLDDGERIYNDEVNDVHLKLKGMMQNEQLKKGLLLSSQSLLHRIESYTSKSFSERRKKEVQVEQGMLKYISRMYSKTSPFSTFTNLAHAEVASSKRFLVQQDDSPSISVKSHIRLNNFLFQYLKALLEKNKMLFQYFPIRRNPTIQNKGDHYLFLTNNNNVEAFQRIPLNDVVKLFLDLVSESSSGIVFKELVETIISNEYIDATKDEIESYITQLIQYGLFEFNLGVSGTDTEWDLTLSKNLNHIAEHEPLIEELLSVLAKIRLYSNEYSVADLNRREQILKEAFSLFKDICMRLHEAAGLPAEERLPKDEYLALQKKKNEEKKDSKENDDSTTDSKNESFKHVTNTYFNFKPEQMYYEDTAYDKKLNVNENELEVFSKKVNGLLESLSCFDNYFDEEERMKHFFMSKYAEDSEVDVLVFYEDFFREFKKAEVDFVNKRNKENEELSKEYKKLFEEAKEDKQRLEQLQKDFNEKAKITLPEQFIVPSIEERNAKMKKWNEKFGELTKGFNEANDVFDIKKEWVEETNKVAFPDSQPLKNVSLGMFVQLYKDDDDSKVKGVLNSTFPGYGKLMSRFLHIFDSQFVNRIREWNLSLAESNEYLVEDCDASYFNANLHPPLMPYEIWMPNGHNNLPPEKQIPVTDIKICLDEGALVLKHKESGNKLSVFDLGFQGHGGRSQLFLLLEKFNSGKLLSWHPLLSIIANKDNAKKDEDKKPEVIIRPRITYEEDVVIQRKSWLIPEELLPIREQNQTDWEYYAHITSWREKYNIPREVFVFIYNRNERMTNEKQIKKSKKLTRDDYKPQYICFDNPFFLLLFEKLLAKVPVNLRLQEMLPGSKDLFSLNDNKHITEFVVQWYN